jgi:hypothetical protein
LLVCVFALATAANGEDKSILFGGLTWNVREGHGGPGPNHWSASTKNVWVDDRDQLHLAIRQVEGAWRCAEIWTRESLGYGVYIFQLASDVSRARACSGASGM